MSSSYKILTINWNPSNKITTLEVSPSNTPSTKYEAKFKQETQNEFDKLHELMRTWPNSTWFVDDDKSQIKFIDNKFPSINVVKQVSKKK